MSERITCVICHHKGDLINKTIASIPKGIEIIVVTSEQGRYFSGTTTIHTKSNNPCRKRNVGVAWSRGDYVAFLDDDVELFDNCLERMARYLKRNEDTGMVYATTKIDDQTFDSLGGYLSWTGFIYEPMEVHFKNVLVLAGKSAVCMTRREFIEQGWALFDEDFVIYGEETDLSWRLWWRGLRSIQMWHAKAYHHTNKDPEFYVKRNIHFHGCKNYVTMLLKNVPARLWYMPIVNALIWNLTAILFLFRNPKVSVWIWQGLWWVVTHFGTIMKKRRRVFRDVNWYWIRSFVCINPPFGYYLNRMREYLTHQLHHGGAQCQRP